MKLVLAARPLNDAAIARWHRTAASSLLDGPPGAIVDRYEAHVPVAPDEQPAAVFARIRERILAYDIFPPRFLQATIHPAGPVAVGSIIVQRIVLGPLALEVAVRVIEVRDHMPQADADERGSGETGFRYVTLQGHPECGVASFDVHGSADGVVTVVLGARSRAGNWLTRLGRPIARRVQREMTRAALRRLVATGHS